MVYDGNCSYVTKARNVQNSGGSMAIIISQTKEVIAYLNSLLTIVQRAICHEK